MGSHRRSVIQRKKIAAQMALSHRRKRMKRRGQPEKEIPTDVVTGTKSRRRLEKEIPMDVVTEEILPRLPPKSVMRFKCVSKLWSLLISSRYFSNRFLTVPSRPRTRVYMCLRDLDDFRSSVTLSLAPDTTTTPSSSFVVDNDLTIPRMGVGCLWQNVRGFMLYNFGERVRIFNPATRQLVNVPHARYYTYPGDHSNVAVSYYFGHDPIKDQYKVVFSTGVYLNNMQDIRSQHRVFLLKPGGGSWRKVSRTPPNYLPHIPNRGGVCIDGVIHYVGWTNVLNYMLVSFHIGSQEFKIIHLPPRELPGHGKNVSVIEYDGKVAIIDLTNLRDKGMLDLWAVKDASNQQWSRKTSVLKSSQLHLVNNNTDYKVKGTTQNGKVFLIPGDLFLPFHILCYDLQNNDMRKIDINGVPDHWFSKDKSKVQVMLMDQIENVMYLKS